METATTTWILRRNPFLRCSEVDDAIHFKSGNECVHVLFTFSFTLEIEVKGEKEIGSFEVSPVIKRMACEDWLAALSS